jgi:hypothetical protein
MFCRDLCKQYLRESQGARAEVGFIRLRLALEQTVTGVISAHCSPKAYSAFWAGLLSANNA